MSGYVRECVRVLCIFACMTRGGLLWQQQMTLRVFLMFWYPLLCWCFSFNCVFAKKRFLFCFFGVGCYFGVSLVITQDLEQQMISHDIIITTEFSFLTSRRDCYFRLYFVDFTKRKTLKITNIRQPLDINEQLSTYTKT